MGTLFQPSEQIEAAVLEAHGGADEQLSAPPFPWDRFASSFASTFNLDEISAQPAEIQRLEPGQFKSALSTPIHEVHCVVKGFDGHLHWLISETDLSRLMTWVLTKRPGKKAIHDPDIEEGFSKFLTLEVLHMIEKIDFVDTLVPRMTEDVDLPYDFAYATDITLYYLQQPVFGRLLISQEFYHAWMKKFGGRRKRKLSPELANQIDIELSVQAGYTQLSLKEWSTVSAGDFILLDSCSVHPHKKEGSLLFALGERSLFNAQYNTSGEVTITDILHATATETPMSDEDDDLFEDDETEEYEEDYDDDDGDDEYEDDDDDEYEEDEEDEEEEESGSQLPSGGMITPEEIPLTLTVEVGRVKMSAAKLLELSSGSVINLEVNPEEGVDLVVNGKCVGRGELIQIGETLGIRVMDRA